MTLLDAPVASVTQVRTRARYAAALLTALALLLTAAGCGADEGRHVSLSSAEEIASRPLPPDGSHNVLLVTVDTLRADHLGCYGYDRDTSPHLDALARDGALFRRAQAPRSLTWPTLATIHTSRYPRTHGVRRNGDRLDPSIPSLPRLLRERGWVAGAFAASMKTAPDPGVDERFSSDHTAPWPEQDRQVTRSAIAWIERHGHRPFFAWLHYIGPHDPYSPDPPYDTMFGDPSSGSFDGAQETLAKITSERIDLSPEDLDRIVSLYDGEIRATDDQLGEVLAAIDRLGLRESTLVIFTADHGEELYQRNHYFQHGCSVYDSTLHVPLVMRLPGVLEPGRVIGPTVELVDVMPTVLGLEGIPPGERPAGIEGIDLSPLLVESAQAPAADVWAALAGKALALPGDRFVDGARFAVAEYRDKVLALRTDEWRYIYNPEGYRPRSGPYKLRPEDPGYEIGREELYRSGTDRLEARDVIEDHPELAARFREALRAWAASRPNVMSEKEFDEETIEELRSLGYIQ